MKLKIQNLDIEIKVIPISKYPDLLRKIKTLPKYFNELSGKTNDQVIEMAPELIANCLPDVLAVFGEATGVSEKDLGDLGFTDLVDIFVAVVKVNRFDEAIAKLKKRVHPESGKSNTTIEEQVYVILDLIASEYGWQAVMNIGFYDAVMLLDLIGERKKENILIMNIASQADPKELRKRLYTDVNTKIKLDETGLERFKNTLNRRSQFKVK